MQPSLAESPLGTEVHSAAQENGLGRINWSSGAGNDPVYVVARFPRDQNDGGMGRREPSRDRHRRRQGTGAYAGSVSGDILIIGHRVHVVTGFVGVWTRQPIGRWSGRPASAEATADRWGVPNFEVPEDFLDNPRVVSDGGNAHGVLATDSDPLATFRTACCAAPWKRPSARARNLSAFSWISSPRTRRKPRRLSCANH